MINPILDPILHKKQLEEVQQKAQFKLKKKQPKAERNNPVLNTTITKKHHDFLTNLSVDLTIKHRKIFPMSEIVRLVFEYASQFKDEIPVFYETCVHNRDL